MTVNNSVPNKVDTECIVQCVTVADRLWLSTLTNKKKQYMFVPMINIKINNKSHYISL